MKQVRCIETGQVYDSAKAAALAHGVTPGMIGHVIKGRQATAAGYTWEYTGGKSPRQKRYKGIYRDHTGRVYNSLRGFAMTHGYTIRQVHEAVATEGGSCRLVDLPVGRDLFAPLPASRPVPEPRQLPRDTLTEDEYWSLILPAIETYRKRGKHLTREEHNAKVLIRNTWITAHPPTCLEFEGTNDRWRPAGVEDVLQ